MPLYISPPPRNPIAAILAAIVGTAVLIGAFMLGFVALLVALVIGALLWLGILIRIKWAQRRMRKQGIDQGIPPRSGREADLSSKDSLDAEYTVISTEKE